MDRVLFIGGSVWQLPPLMYAKKRNLRTVLVDNDDKAPGKKYADEFYKISIVEKKKICDLARKLKIKGVVAYGSDIAAPTAAYISDKLKLPGNPYTAVKILTNKNLFRKFLKKINLTCQFLNLFLNKLLHFLGLKKLDILFS